MYELALAQVLIEANVASINPANITDERFDTELCGLVTHLFEQVDTTEIFAQFTAAFENSINALAAEWQQWFGEVEEDTNEIFAQFTAEWQQFTAEWQRWF